MAGFYLYSSNSQNRLISLLADVLKTPLSSPLGTEMFVVQSLGMQRWMALKLADLLGIFANAGFWFPNEIITHLFETVIPGAADLQRLDRDIILWRLLDVMPDLLARPSFEDLDHYLQHSLDADPLKSYQLAKRIAHVFDQYCMYRPDMILEWEEGDRSGWQPELWRAASQDRQTVHLPALKRQFMENLDRYVRDGGILPERLSIFGVSTLPPLHIEILAAASKHIEIHFFFLNPSREYWADIRSEKDIARSLSRLANRSVDASDLFYEVGNSLVASLGKAGQRFFNILMGIDCIEETDEGDFVEPGDTSLLRRIQSDIYHLREPAIADNGKPVIAAEDVSLQIHVCHSRMREVEVLHDRLLAMFDRFSDLTPGEVLVMAPDINPYVPFIHSVFSPDGGGGPHFPYSIADQNYQQNARVIPFFLKLLDLPTSRFSRSAVLDLLESEAIRDRFSLTADHLDQVREWVDRSRIRWGIDAEHKTRFDTPAVHENTWEFGLQRMLLGIAMPDDGELPFEGVLPFDGIEGSDTIQLGWFLDFYSKLTELVRHAGNDSISGSRILDRSRSLDDWSTYLIELLETFFPADDRWEGELQSLREIFGQMNRWQMGSGYERQVPFDVVRSVIREKISDRSIGAGFLGAGITFCSMLPMRSIPAKVIVLLGLNEQSYPRITQPLSFDLMAQDPRMGDRSQKDDDRYLMLEALISAESVLYISYVGQSIIDNSTIPPSSLVNELLFYVEKNFTAAAGDIRHHLVRNHYLQAFNPNYFQPGDIQSYSRENLEASRALLKRDPGAVNRFISELSPPSDEWKTVDLEDLVQFFNNPARYLLKKRLGLALEDDLAETEETEPFSLDHLDRYRMRELILDYLLDGRSVEWVEKRFRAEGILPPKELGGYLFDQVLAESREFAGTIEPYLDGERLDPVPVDIGIGDFRLTGHIRNIWPAGVVHYRYAAVKAKDRLQNWLEHLLLNLLREKPDKRSRLIGLGKNKKPWVWTSDPYPRTMDYLERMLALYWQGLSSPIPFFPRSSLKYMETRLGRQPEKALSAARGEWDGYSDNAERTDGYFAICFGNSDPLDERFSEISETVLGPILDYQKQE